MSDKKCPTSSGNSFQEGVLTLRNSLDHLDLSDKSRRESSKQADDHVDDEDDEEAAASDIKPVTVRFAKSGADSEKYKKAREKSFEFQQQKARSIFRSFFPAENLFS
jgi:hypothetical protein